MRSGEAFGACSSASPVPETCTPSAPARAALRVVFHQQCGAGVPPGRRIADDLLALARIVGRKADQHAGDVDGPDAACSAASKERGCGKTAA